MKIFKNIIYQLYLLQLENYELKRYFKLLWQKGLWAKEQTRKQLVWTAKAKALMLMAAGLNILIVTGLLFWAGGSRLYVYVFVLLIALLLFNIYFLLFTTALLVLWPFDFVAKQIVITRAKSRIKKIPGLKIIGIAGSYGKTTMKEVLSKVLGSKYKVLNTPESVNTPVGISKWILKEVGESTEILIVEMGEHYKGDIAYLCKITRPDISVITGINESHLERMGSLENIVSTIFEVVSATQAGGLVVINGDDERVIKNYKKFIWPDHRVEKFSIFNFQFSKFDAEKLCWNSEIPGVGKVSINLLGEYALGDVDVAVKIAKNLGLTAEEIKTGIETLKPVEHRLQPIRSSGGILVIDDAYNGNPDGVREAIKVLSQFKNRRKVFITPGLVEMGKASAEVHRNIGKQLASVADVVILIKNSVTPYIEFGILNFELGTKVKPQIIFFVTAQTAHSSLGQILKPNDVVLFQNDWGDQYL